MSTDDIRKAIQQARQIDRQLSETDIDWDGAGKRAKQRPLSTFLKETKRFDATSNLYLKVEDTVAEAQKRGVEDVQAVILKRTLLRAVALHLMATLKANERPESDLPLDERRKRVDLLSAPVLEFFAGEEGPNATRYEPTIAKGLDAWRAGPNAQTAGAAVQALDGVFADALLTRLAEWRRQDPGKTDERRRAVVLQADMRQIFYVIYPRAFERDRDGAWRTLTEFTNDPKRLDAAYVEKTVKADFAAALAALDAGLSE